MKGPVIERMRIWVFSLQGKFITVASLCIIVFTTIGSFIIISREEKLYRRDIENQGKVLAEISRLMLTNVMVYQELGMMDKQDLSDYLDYFIIDFMRRDKRVKYVAVADNSGKIVACSDITRSGTYSAALAALTPLRGGETLITGGKFGSEPVIDIETPLNIDTKSWGGLEIVLSTKTIEEAITSLKKEISFITAMFFSLSLVIVSIGAKVLSKPVVQLSNAMDSIETHGDLEEHNVEMKESHDELGKLQNSFLWMIQRLRDAERERKKTVEVLCQAEKMVSVGRLASGVAHEINNPLAGITLCFKNLMENRVDEHMREKLVFAINDGLQKIEGIVEHLLDFSRMTITERKPANVNSLVNNILVLLNYHFLKKDINVVNDLSDDLPDILIDENKMAQVFMNIMMNAVQSMEEGGTLTARTRRDGVFCTIFIEDTGCGIPPDVLPNIFDPFFTTKATGEGTGLGLSVSKGIVEQHGGSIQVESVVGKGTVFRIALPVTVNT